MLFQEVLEGVSPVGPFLFGDFVITILIYFVIVKGDAFQGFEKPTVLATELVCALYVIQCSCFAIATSLEVPIQTVVVVIHQITGFIGQRFLYVLKFIWQLGAKHLFVKALKRLHDNALVLELEFSKLFLEFAFGVQGANFLELFG